MINTELDLRVAAAASNDEEVTRLHSNRERQIVQLETSFSHHLNGPNSKPRVGNKRKNVPGQKAQPKNVHKNNKGATIMLSHGGAKMTVTTAGGETSRRRSRKSKRPRENAAVTKLAEMPGQAFGAEACDEGWSAHPSELD